MVSLLNKLGINDKDELLITNLTNFVRINFHDVTILHFLRKLNFSNLKNVGSFPIIFAGTNFREFGQN